MVSGLMRGVSALALVMGLASSAAAETAVERGRYLVNGIAACGNCHTPQGPGGPAPGRELAGGTPFKEVLFTAYAANITPDPETGIGKWTDAQIAVAIREGKRPDGSLIGPPMPFAFYKHISDADLAAMVAYLRSVPPVTNAVPKSDYRMPLPPAWTPPVALVPEVTRVNPVAYGAYMAGPLGHCLDCHTPLLPNGQRDMARAGAGGQPFEGPWGVSVARNITSDPEHGLGKWTDGEIVQAVTKGIRPDGARLFPPMGFHYYASITPEDLAALVAYLRTLPPRQ